MVVIMTPNQSFQVFFRGKKETDLLQWALTQTNHVDCKGISGHVDSRGGSQNMRKWWIPWYKHDGTCNSLEFLQLILLLSAPKIIISCRETLWTQRVGGRRGPAFLPSMGSGASGAGNARTESKEGGQSDVALKRRWWVDMFGWSMTTWLVVTGTCG